MKASKNPLLLLCDLGQSPWCDQLSRELLESGRLARVVSEQRITALTPNPAIFHKALGGDCGLRSAGPIS